MAIRANPLPSQPAASPALSLRIHKTNNTQFANLHFDQNLFWCEFSQKSLAFSTLELAADIKTDDKFLVSGDSGIDISNEKLKIGVLQPQSKTFDGLSLPCFPFFMGI